MLVVIRKSLLAEEAREGDELKRMPLKRRLVLILKDRVREAKTEDELERAMRELAKLQGPQK